ncbi:MAG: hypothetical protein FJZ01_06900 [Candidatus Sericytochromatia bacterium]|nr:hypothetical protein [Candidatus Tanganyikabacteria bacterium]
MTAVATESHGARTVPDLLQVRHALVSVFAKERLEDLLGALSGRGITIWSTGGTFKELERQAPRFDYRLAAISDLTGYPEMPGGLVKTLHPKIHAGILAEPFAADQDAYLERIETVRFDLVVCNLYPFQEVSRLPGVTVERLRQNIDIGGPTMLRAAAKNFLRVATVVDPADYDLLRGDLPLEVRWNLARKAFRHVLDYDRAISETLDGVDLARLREGYLPR